MDNYISAAGRGMNVNKLVSFVVTTKNEEANLACCLKAIRKQMYKNAEIIVVDSYRNKIKIHR